jgi:hypothetical protein
MTQIKITPISQDNKGRFNRRLITLTGEKLGYNNNVLVGVTDTGKEVFVKPIAGNSVGIRYTSDDNKLGYRYCSSLGWKNQYELTSREIESLNN